MKIVTAEEMRAIDRATSERFGVPSLTLMENAGTAVSDYVLAHPGEVQRVVIFCGKGNNGGDGFVAARRLHQQGKKVQVILLADPGELRGDAAVMFGKLPAAAIAVHSSEELKSERVKLSLTADLYLDAVLGTGFKPPVSGLYAEAIAIMNASQIPVIAVDIPSGADANGMARRPGRLLGRIDRYFHSAASGAVFGQLTNGPTCVATSVRPMRRLFPSASECNHCARSSAAVAPRAADSNKGSYGHVLVIGGSPGKLVRWRWLECRCCAWARALSTVATANRRCRRWPDSMRS